MAQYFYFRKYKIGFLLISAFFSLMIIFYATIAYTSGGLSGQVGTIAAKSIVLSDKGNPIWVEYDKNGNVVRKICEDDGDMVMSPAAYRAYAGDRPVSIPDSARSVLVGRNGDIIATSDMNIGYLVAFYTSKDIADPVSATDGKKSMYKYKMGDDLWGPISGARIWAGAMNCQPGYSDEKGTFVVNYYIPSCPGHLYVEYPIYLEAELRYQRFNPKSSSTGFYYEGQICYDGCSGYSEGISPLSLLEVAAKVQIAANEASMPIYMVRSNFSIDVAFVTGRASMESGSDIVYIANNTEYSLKSSSIGQGLLMSINQLDLKNTDVYIYRMSNDQLVATLHGLKSGQVSISDDKKYIINYQTIIRGPAANNKNDFTEFEAWRKMNNIDSSSDLWKREADHLRVGEKVKVIIINRATGYIGSSVGTYGGEIVDATGSQTVYSSNISVYPGDVTMRPPNLEIKAERKYKIEAGLTEGEEPEYIIGFEGSALTSDHYIAVITEWYDWDGTPLPDDLPGYTGRLAKVVDTNILQQASNQIANFGIKPGHHTQLVRLPQPGIEEAHYYIHVNGEPITGNSNFLSTGTGADALIYRPKHYVPVKVPFFDEATTNARRAINPYSEAVYNWEYRPEMQFSLFDLKLKKLQIVLEGEDPDDSSTVISLGSYIIYLSPFLRLLDDVNIAKLFYWALNAGDFDPLPPFGTERELVFSIGEHEVIAEAGPDGSVDFNPEALSLIDPTDILAIRLYQNNDKENVLWELTFTGLNIQGHLPGQITTIRTEENVIAEKNEDDPFNLVVLVNDDNDDEDPVSTPPNPQPADNDDKIVSSFDDDIIKITLRQNITPGNNQGTLMLSVPSGASDIRVFNSNPLDSSPFYSLVDAELIDWSVDLSSPSGDLYELAAFQVIDIYLEGLNPNPDVTMKLAYLDINGNEIYSDEVHIAVLKVDLDIDSDNNNANNLPDRNDDEEIIEDIEGWKPGKLIVVNNRDADKDNIPDFADFDITNNSAQFTPLVLELPEPIDISKAKIRFTYSESDPQGVTGSGTDGDPYRPSSGHIRIWTKNANEIRGTQDINSGGNFIRSTSNAVNAEFMATDLGFSNSTRTVTFYVEGINASTEIADQEILIGVNIDDYQTFEVCKDMVRVTVIDMDLDIDSDNNNGFNPPARSAKEDEIEDYLNERGKIICVNDGDIDKDGIPNFADGFDIYSNSGSSAGGYFTPIILGVPEAVDNELDKYKVRFTYVSSDPDAVIRQGDGSDENPYNYQSAPGSGYLRIWTKDGMNDRKKADINNSGDFIKSDELYKLSDLCQVADYYERELKLYIEAVNPWPWTNTEGQRVQVDVFRDELYIGEDTIRVTALKIDLDIDSDNNLQIQDEDELVENKKPGLIFWANENAINDDVINDFKDLENFTTLILQDICLHLPEGYNYYLEMDKITGSPAIRVFPKFGDELRYLNDEGTAYAQLKVASNSTPLGEVSENQPLLLDHEIFQNFPTTKRFLFEGIKAGEFRLRLALRDSNGILVGKDEVIITLKWSMFPVIDFRQCEGDNYDPAFCMEAVIDQKRISPLMDLKKEKVVVFVHGYAVSLDRAFSSSWTVFRRLYWTGVVNPAGTSDFLGIAWRGDEGAITKPMNPFFNDNVFNAFQASIPIGRFLKDLGDDPNHKRVVNVLAHSLGNGVVSNAIKATDGIKIDKYILHEAAVAANAYNANYDGEGVPTFKPLVGKASRYGYPDDIYYSFIIEYPPFSSCLHGMNCIYEIWAEPRWTQVKYLDKLDNNVDYWDSYFSVEHDRIPEVIGDPWGNYFIEVPDKVKQMINTYSDHDPVVGVIWQENQILHRPDLCLGTYDWENLPDSPTKSEREWAELAYYFGAVSRAAGFRAIPDVRIKNIYGVPLGIKRKWSDKDHRNKEVHSAFTDYSYYEVWPFWKYIAGELKQY